MSDDSAAPHGRAGGTALAHSLAGSAADSAAAAAPDTSMPGGCSWPWSSRRIRPPGLRDGRRPV